LSKKPFIGASLSDIVEFQSVHSAIAGVFCRSESLELTVLRAFSNFLTENVADPTPTLGQWGKSTGFPAHSVLARLSQLRTFFGFFGLIFIECEDFESVEAFLSAVRKTGRRKDASTSGPGGRTGIAMEPER
jgi:hypothetical protein